MSSEMQDQMSLIFLYRLKPKSNNARSWTVKYKGLHQLNTDWVVPLLSMVLLFVVSPHRQQSLSILCENFQQTNSTFKQTNTQTPKNFKLHTITIMSSMTKSHTIGFCPFSGMSLPYAESFYYITC